MDLRNRRMVILETFVASVFYQTSYTLKEPAYFGYINPSVQASWGNEKFHLLKNIVLSQCSSFHILKIDILFFS